MPPILLVDDDTTIRKMLRAILEEEGYTVREAPDGAAALARLRLTSRRMIVLLDILMPIMNGVEVLRTVVADSALTARHRYIVQTANSEVVRSPEVQALLAQLDVPVLCVPFSVDDVLDAVERAGQRMS